MKVMIRHSPRALMVLGLLVSFLPMLGCASLPGPADGGSASGGGPPHAPVPERELLVVRLDTGRLEALLPGPGPLPAGSRLLGKIVVPRDTPPGTILSLYRTREGDLFVLLGDRFPAGAESLGGVAVPPLP